MHGVFPRARFSDAPAISAVDPRFVDVGFDRLRSNVSTSREIGAPSAPGFAAPDLTEGSRRPIPADRSDSVLDASL